MSKTRRPVMSPLNAHIHTDTLCVQTRYMFPSYIPFSHTCRPIFISVDVYLLLSRPCLFSNKHRGIRCQLQRWKEIWRQRAQKREELVHTRSQCWKEHEQISYFFCGQILTWHLLHSVQCIVCSIITNFFFSVEILSTVRSEVNQSWKYQHWHCWVVMKCFFSLIFFCLSSLQVQVVYSWNWNILASLQPEITPWMLSNTCVKVKCKFKTWWTAPALEMLRAKEVDPLIL